MAHANPTLGVLFAFSHLFSPVTHLQKSRLPSPCYCQFPILRVKKFCPKAPSQNYAPVLLASKYHKYMPEPKSGKGHGTVVNQSSCPPPPPLGLKSGPPLKFTVTWRKVKYPEYRFLIERKKRDFGAELSGRHPALSATLTYSP